jgi:hypothetical protein
MAKRMEICITSSIIDSGDCLLNYITMIVYSHRCSKVVLVQPELDNCDFLLSYLHPFQGAFFLGPDLLAKGQSKTCSACEPLSSFVCYPARCFRFLASRAAVSLASRRANNSSSRPCSLSSGVTYPVVMLIDLAVTLLPVVELAARDADPMDQPCLAQFRSFAPISHIIHDVIPGIRFGPGVSQPRPSSFFKRTWWVQGRTCHRYQIQVCARANGA